MYRAIADAARTYDGTDPVREASLSSRKWKHPTDRSGKSTWPLM
jgi:hypothetical protein